MGIGGLHSCEKKQYIEAKDTHFLQDRDVQAYYPSIILQQEISPKNMGQAFLTLYKGIVTERVFAKKMAAKLQCRIETLEREIKDAITKKNIQ